MRPGNSWLGGTTGQRQMEPICFVCGKTSYIQANCPDKKAKPCTAAAAHIQNEEHTGMRGNITPMDDTQEGETLPENEDTKREHLSLGEEDHPQVTPGDDEYPLSQYNWDDEDDDTGSLFMENALSTPDMGYCIRKSQAVMHDKHVIITTCCPDHKSSNNICLQAGVTTGGKPPLYDHCVLSCMGMRPMRSCECNQTLSGYWEINGTRAHCLLNSRCKGVMISPNYVWAMGIPMFKLEHPVGLQVTCVGSKSTINYGAKSSIAFGNKHVKEYFNMANIDHYNVILGTPFLWRLGITLDFTGQGIICIDMYIVPMNKPSESSDDLQKMVATKPSKLWLKPPE